MRIENFRVETKGQVVATFDVLLERSELSLRHFRIVRGSKGFFVSSPSFKDHNDNFVAIAEFAGAKDIAFKKKLMELLESEISALKKLEP